MCWSLDIVVTLISMIGQLYSVQSYPAQLILSLFLASSNINNPSSTYKDLCPSLCRPGLLSTHCQVESCLLITASSFLLIVVTDHQSGSMHSDTIVTRAIDLNYQVVLVIIIVVSLSNLVVFQNNNLDPNDVNKVFTTNVLFMGKLRIQDLFEVCKSLELSPLGIENVFLVCVCNTVQHIFKIRCHVSQPRRGLFEVCKSLKSSF